MKAADWNPQETLYAFMGWLTSRDERTEFSAVLNAAPGADLVAEFAKAFNLPEPRSGERWHRPEEWRSACRMLRTVRVMGNEPGAKPN